VNDFKAQNITQSMIWFTIRQCCDDSLFVKDVSDRMANCIQCWEMKGIKITFFRHAIGLEFKVLRIRIIKYIKKSRSEILKKKKILNRIGYFFQ